MTSHCLRRSQRGWGGGGVQLRSGALGGGGAWRWLPQPLAGPPWALEPPYCHGISTQTHLKTPQKVFGRGMPAAVRPTDTETGRATPTERRMRIAAGVAAEVGGALRAVCCRLGIGSATTCPGHQRRHPVSVCVCECVRARARVCVCVCVQPPPCRAPPTACAHLHHEFHSGGPVLLHLQLHVDHGLHLQSAAQAPRAWEEGGGGCRGAGPHCNANRRV